MEYSNSSTSRDSGFMIATKKYNKGHTHRTSFEENIAALMDKAYTPLSLVDFREFRKFISSLDPRIVPVLRLLLSIKFISLKYEASDSYVMT